MSSHYISLVLCFSIYSFWGWILETIFKTVRDRHFVNSGFLKGPYLPIYGCGALMTVQIFNMLYHLGLDDNSILTMIWTMVVVVFFISLLEYTIGGLLELLFKRRWWDYSDEKFNIKGRVSLKYSILWGVLGCLVIYFIQPFLVQELQVMSMDQKFFLTVFTMMLITLDVVISVGSLWDSTTYITSGCFQLKYTLMKNDSGLLDSEYASYINDIITNPQVQTMRQFRHHKNITCWDHSLNVSYTSYRVCKYLGWDYVAAARGGVLHDLFLYDWRTTELHEGRHGYVHPQIALTNATGMFTLNSLEKDIILKHMFPLTLSRPIFKESFLVCMVDKYCTLREIFSLTRQFRLPEDGERFMLIR